MCLRLQKELGKIVEVFAKKKKIRVPMKSVLKDSY